MIYKSYEVFYMQGVARLGVGDRGMVMVRQSKTPPFRSGSFHAPTPHNWNHFATRSTCAVPIW